MKYTIAFLLGVVTFITGYYYYNNSQDNVGTEMTGSAWFVNSSQQVQLALTTWGLKLPSLSSSGDCLVTNASGVVSTSSCGGGSGTSTVYLATSTPWTTGNLAYVTGSGTVGSVATGTLTETATGLEFNATRALVGGSAILSLTSGYAIPTTTDFTNWNTAYASTTALTPSYIRNLFSSSATGLTYTAGTGAFSLTGGYGIPLTASTTEWATAYASTTAMTPTYTRGLFSNTATGLTYTGATGITALTAGYNIPLSASTTNWNGFYDTPSTRITAGTNLSWSGNTLNATGGSGSISTTSADYIIYKSGATTYAVDGNDMTAITNGTDLGAIIESVMAYATGTKSVAGGKIVIKAGEYTSSGTSTVYGESSNNNSTWIIEGAGSDSTNITQDGGSFLHFTNRAEVVISNLSIDVSGVENAFSAQGLTTGVRSIWNSNFSNIKIHSSTANHTGYAFYFGNDFRNHYENIELFGVGNGYRTYTEGSAFNNGDSTFVRWFCEINNASNGICFDIDASAGGSVNQSTYIDVNGIADGAGSHTFIKMTGANHNTFIGVNAEQFATTTQLVSGRNNTFEFEYVTPSASGNYFFTGSSAYNNSIGCRYMDNPTGAHILWDDDSNIRGQHNILQGVGNANCVLQGAGTYSVSTTSASIMTNIHDNITGTGLAALLDELKVFGDRIVFDFQTAGTSFMRMVSNVWSLTISNIEVLSLSSTGVKISDDADGALTFTGQSAGNDESLTWNYDDGTANTVGVSSASGVTTVDWGTVGADYDSVSVTLSTILGIIDAGGATSFEIPNGTSPTINATGTIALDTNDNQVVVGTSTTGAVIRLTDRIGGFSISSTTYPYVSGFTTGVAIPFVMERDGYVVTEIHCDIDGGTSIVVNFDNGTGNTSTVTCDTDGASVTGLNSNNVVTAGSVSTSVETGTVTGSPDRLRVSVFGYWVRE